jgi:hypothetical protein
MSEKMRQLMEEKRQEKQLKLEQSISRIKTRQVLANDSTSAYSRDHSVQSAYNNGSKRFSVPSS